MFNSLFILDLVLNAVISLLVLHFMSLDLYINLGFFVAIIMATVLGQFKTYCKMLGGKLPSKLVLYSQYSIVFWLDILFWPSAIIRSIIKHPTERNLS